MCIHTWNQEAKEMDAIDPEPTKEQNVWFLNESVLER